MKEMRCGALSLISQVLLLIVSICIRFEMASTSQSHWSGRDIVTKHGILRGTISQPFQEFEGFPKVETFYAVPYAAPPVHSKRFSPPELPSAWQGVRKHDTFSPVCPQWFPSIRDEQDSLKMMPSGRLSRLRRVIPLLSNQSEDCLYLNLYIPYAGGEKSSSKSTDLFPVLVFVHGDEEGFGGPNLYDPSVLCAFGSIIVVTFNYRLGILGFLNANDGGPFKLPKNFALLDQLAALQWIQENVEKFGGDPRNVTLMGHAKGAAYVNFIMTSHAVPKGQLFQRVILSSGSSMSPVYSDLAKSGAPLAKKFAVRVRCPQEPPSAMLECLRQIPLKDITQSELWPKFGPSSDDIVIEKNILENTVRERISHYPLLFGVVTSELLWTLSEHDASYGMEKERRRELLKNFIQKYYKFHQKEILAGAIHEYTDWEKPFQNPISVRDETVNALADAQVIAPLTNAGDLHSKAGKRASAFFYVFDHPSVHSFYEQGVGCVQGEDLMYVFGVPFHFYERLTHEPFPLHQSSFPPKPEHQTFTFNFTIQELYISQNLMTFWANFISMGNPNGHSRLKINQRYSSSTLINLQHAHISNSSGILGLRWPSYDHFNKRYLYIGTEFKVKNHYRAHKLSFWMRLVEDFIRGDQRGAPLGHHIFPLLANEEGLLTPLAAASPILSSFTNHSSSPGLKNVKDSSMSETKSGVRSKKDDSYDKNDDNDDGNSSLKTDYISQKESQESHDKIRYSETEKNQQDERAVMKKRNEGGNNESWLQMYSTALSVTIAVGSSLLLLNLFVFASFFVKEYERFHDVRRNRRLRCRRQRQCISNNTPSDGVPIPLEECRIVTSGPSTSTNT